MPNVLLKALRTGGADDVKAALIEMDRSDEIYFIKTHAPPHKLHGVASKAILIVRDARDSIASFANYCVDIPYDQFALRTGWRSVSKWRALDPRIWFYLGKATLIALLKRLGFRKHLVSRQVDRLLAARDSTYFNWGLMNRAWLGHSPKPHLVFFEDLIREPVETVRKAVRTLGLRLEEDDKDIPDFESLKAAYPNFFRKGVSNDWTNWMSPAQEATVWKLYGDVITDLGLSEK
jgi:hypothetical protein